MRVALVTNAASGGGTDGERIAALLRDAGAEVAVHAFDPDDGDGRHRAPRPRPRRPSAPTGSRVAGGDGSIGPVAVHAAAAGLPLAVIPTGTANDFARALDIPRDLEAACALAVHETRERPIDLLRAGERPFLNAASVGLSVIAAHHARPLKRPLGPFAYAVGALRAGLTAKPLRCHVTADGAPGPLRARRGRSSSRGPAPSAAGASSTTPTPPTGSSTSRSSRPARASSSSAARGACAAAT